MTSTNRITWVLFSAFVLAGSGRCEASTTVTGAYRFDDGGLVSIRELPQGPPRYRDFDTGKSGRLEETGDGIWVSGNGFRETSPVALTVRALSQQNGKAATLRWDRSGEASRRAVRINREEDVRFASKGTEIAGRLYLPQSPGPHPGVVVVHGSGEYAATSVYYDGDFLAAHGVATLIYDRRGTGRSAGEVTHDFDVLATDVVSAVDFMTARTDIDANKIGLVGHSQGGWVAPLAASRSAAVRFVVVNFGLIESPREEARTEMMEIVRSATSDPKALANADKLIDAAVTIVASNFKQGWREFKAAVKVSRGEAWFDALRNTPVGQLARYPRWIARLVGPRRAQRNLSWDHRSDAVLATLPIPMLWVLGEKDRSAPNEKTIGELRALIKAGKPIELVVLPGADHTGLLFAERGKERLYTGYSPDYFRMVVEWIVSRTGGESGSR